MGFLDRRVENLGSAAPLLRRGRASLYSLLVAFLAVFLAGADYGFASQTDAPTVVATGNAVQGSLHEHSTAGVSGPSLVLAQHSPQPGAHGEAAPRSQASEHGKTGGAHSTAEKAQTGLTPTPGVPGLSHETPKELAQEHHEGDGAHGPPLPEISPIPGVSFVETMINLMDFELRGRFLGWRPNDIIFGRFTDNINSYQLGVLEAIRFTTLRLKDSLTRMGDADAYDPDLEQALNLFMNRSTLFWFPSAETSYGEAVDHLKAFKEKLKGGQRNFYYRVDTLLALINIYKDLMGNVNRNLIRPVGWFESDDYFYYAKGVAHVYYEILRVVRVGFKNQLSSTLNALDIMDEIIHELYRAEQLDPWIVFDAELDDSLANHRANLNAPLSEVAHLLGVISHF